MLAPDLHPEVIRKFLAGRTGDIGLRLVVPSDAEFILRLRLDAQLGANISPTSPKVSDQVDWIEAYIERFEQGAEAYFLIMCRDNPVGTARLYDYKAADNSFCWGSWLIATGTSPAAAFASMKSVYEMGFEALDFTKARFDVRQANRSVWTFHERLGARLVSQTEADRYYELDTIRYAATAAVLDKLTRQMS